MDNAAEKEEELAAGGVPGSEQDPRWLVEMMDPRVRLCQVAPNQLSLKDPLAFPWNHTPAKSDSPRVLHTHTHTPRIHYNPCLPCVLSTP